jgi:basic membrane protein A and related proteins
MMQMTRRGFLGGAGGAALAFGCVSTARAANTTIGFIYVGSKDDYGWNQSHAVAAAALKNIPGITVVEEENVPETDAVSKTMESMINLDGATLIFPTSFGYFNPFMLEEAKKFPNVFAIRPACGRRGRIRTTPAATIPIWTRATT